MDINRILNADYLDILFEGRNKEYGGYELRKRYRRRALLAGLIAVLVVGGFFASLMIKPKEKPVENLVPVIAMKNLPPPQPINPKKPPPPPPPSTPPPPVKPTVKFTPPVIKKNEEVKEENIAKPPKPESNEVVGPKNIAGSNDPNAINPNLSNVSGNGKGPVVPAEPAPDQIFRNVQQMPSFPGGLEAMYNYIRRNVRYPQIARQQQIEGKVFVQFVVDENGNITNVTLPKGDIGGGCGDEAMRVIKSMPKWSPGKQNGRAVKVYYIATINFTLNN